MRAFRLSRLSLVKRSLVFTGGLLVIALVVQVRGVSGSSGFGLFSLGLAIICIPVGVGELIWKAVRPAVWIGSDLVRLNVFLGRSVLLVSNQLADLRVEKSGLTTKLRVTSRLRTLVVPIRFDGDSGALEAELREIVGLATSDIPVSRWS